MSSNPRRTPVTRPDGGLLTIKTTMLKKGSTFHSPMTPPTSPETTFRPPALPRRSQTNLDDVIGSHRRRAALTIREVDEVFSTRASPAPPSSLSSPTIDNSFPMSRGILHHTIDTSITGREPEVERKILHPRTRRPSRYGSDSGIGTSLTSANEKRTSASLGKKEKTSTKVSAVTRSALARGGASATMPGLSERATNRIFEHTLKPLLAQPSFKDYHPLVLECPKKIQREEITCLRDLEKTLLLVAPEKSKTADIYLDFCLTTIRCIQATVEYLTEREQTRPRDLPYSGGYFIDLVDQIHQYARQLAEAKEKGEEDDGMDIDPTDEIKLHGGIHVNGRPAELVRVKKNGKAISIATGLPIEGIEEELSEAVRIKRSASQEAEDEEEIMRSMARRKKNASPEELAPKKCREPGCNKEFKRPCDLTKHEKTHSRPWKCPVPTCKYHEYGWPTEKEMDRHHNDKHSSAPPMFECMFKPCPYKSKRESNCKQHMEKAHGWNYIRTKSNGKKPGVPSVNSEQPTPQLQNIPTPSSGHSLSVATPPDEFSRFYGHNNWEFPSFPNNEADLNMIPQEINIDYSPIDNSTPSTDSGMERNSAYQDLSNDFTIYEDIYGANVRLPAPTPIHNRVFQKELQHFATPYAPAPTAASYCPPQPANISPTGHGNSMLFTPTSMAEVDEGFDEHRDFAAALGNGLHDGSGGGDFILFPGAMSKSLMGGGGGPGGDSLFSAAEMPSLAAGYSQPNSQDLMGGVPIQGLANIDWSAYGLSQHSYQQR